MKKTFVVLLIMLLMFNSACGSIYTPSAEGSSGLQQDQTSFEEEVKEVYYLVGMQTILPYWHDHRSGFEAAGKELNIKTVVTGVNGNDALRQVDIFEKAVSENPAGILVSAVDKLAMAEPINRAIAKGIPVICLDNDVPKSNRLTYIGTDNYKTGYLAAEMIGDRLDGSGDVGILTNQGIYSLDERQNGFEACIAEKYPEINIVAVMNNQSDPLAATYTVRQMLDKFPSIDGIFGTDAFSGAGIAIALEERSKLGVVKVVTFDNNSSVIELVEQGKIEASLVQRTFTMSYYGLKLLYDFNHSGNLSNDGISMMPEKIDTGIIVITKENADGFK